MAWQKVASLGDFGDRDAIGIEVAGTPIALFRLGNEVHATSGACTHEFALLADGFVETDDGSVECPLHQALFDIRTGKALCAPATENLKVYPVRIDGSDISIDMDGAVRKGAAIAAAAAPRAAAAEPCKRWRKLRPALCVAGR
jgi:nitrite reductase/ring-hydroxylating ferredoxin subunit